MAAKSINPSDKVKIDYAQYDEVQKLQPTVYRDGDSFAVYQALMQKQAFMDVEVF